MIQMAIGQIQQKPSWLKHLDFTVVDLLVLAASFVLAYYLKFGDLSFVDSSKWKALMAMLLLANLVVTLLTGPYSGVFRRSYWEDVGANLKLALWSFLIACVIFYLFKIGEDYSREMLVMTYIAYLVLSLIFKAILKKALLSRTHDLPEDSKRRVVLVASAANVAKMEELASASDMNSLDIVGFCFPDAQSEGEHHKRVSAPVADLADLAIRVNADEVLVATNPALIDAESFEALIEDGVRVRFAIAESLGVNAENQVLGRAGVMKTLDLERYSFGSGQLFYLPIKRLLDIVFGVIGCVLALLVSVVVKVCYLASGDSHSIFYKHKRIGQRGKPFDLYKIRSMVWNADEVLQELLKDPDLRAEWEADQKLSNDPRITGIGRILRKTSMDELPQFLNVLKGDMSVVGPRPLVPGELEEHGGRPLYNKVKPGITGWWACNGRSNIDYRERLELEYHYVRHCSLYLDVLCVLRTFVAVLKRDGAQ